jgi:ferredoxin
MTMLILALGWTGVLALAAAAVLVIVTSIAERRWRAAWISGAILVPVAAALAALLVAEFPGKVLAVGVAVGLGLALVVALVLPLGRTTPLRIVSEQGRVDERDAVFHRFYRLEPGTPEYDAYYEEHPDALEFDEAVRALPQLGHPGHATYHSLASGFEGAMSGLLHDITREIDWPPRPIEGAPIDASAEEFTRRIKGFARYLGADLVGVTALDQAYVYSHIGRAPGPWGQPIELDHANAVAIAVEMSHDMVRHAPDICTTTETALKYFEAGKIAMILARYIGRLGYRARAHVDGNYRVMCPPIAADAGLGELGRLGVLVTRRFGPRVRLAIVTTDLPLCHDRPAYFGVQEFCTICKKCADNCPSGSIDAGPKRVSMGAEKWPICRDTCYRFWRQRSSDCAICVKVCPYSHPDTLVHNVVRRAIERNSLARRVALVGDDLLYGRKPVDRAPLPSWHDHG